MDYIVGPRDPVTLMDFPWAMRVIVDRSTLFESCMCTTRTNRIYRQRNSPPPLVVHVD